jgi:hypothetical protein
VLFNPIVERIANYRNCSAAQVSHAPPCAVSSPAIHELLVLRESDLDDLQFHISNDVSQRASNHDPSQTWSELSAVNQGWLTARIPTLYPATLAEEEIN